jgi:hypothetical protein
MNRVKQLFLFSLLLISIFAFADGTNNFPGCVKPKPHHAVVYHPPARSYYQPYEYVVTMVPGSLKQNIVRIGHQYGWRTVVWNVPEDYIWVGRATVRGDSLSSIMMRILVDYPLQAQFYQGNHVLAIVPRNLP